MYRMTVDSEAALVDMWPPFGLRIAARDDRHEIVVRVLRDEDVARIAGVGVHDVYGDDVPEHAFPWAFHNSPQSSAQHRWSNRANLSSEEWSLDFLVTAGGEPIGVVDMRSSDFAHTQEVSTGSWVFHRFQGQGFGTLVRHAVAQFCFDHLGAASIASGWVVGNAASESVSRKLGYELLPDDGETAPCGPEGEPRPVRRGRLPAADYKPAARVECVGLTPQLRTMLGA